MSLEIHVDPLGGWSGDMFVAACLDCFPALWPDVQAAIASLALGSAAACRLEPHRDMALTGRRFIVAGDVQSPGDHDSSSAELHHNHHGTDDHHHHPDRNARDEHSHGHGGHRHWADIRAALQASALERSVVDHAVGIFHLLAQAEAQVHGVDEDSVAFHEVGAVDSIVDIVAAALLIDRIGANRWMAAPLPVGGGRVRTAHGILPVPAPATALLLRGLETIDDGISGERVTPTGAAVARYLLSPGSGGPRKARRLSATGIGFGSRRLPGISNCLRILAFEQTAQVASAFTHRELGVIAFEVDDQSAEDLAHGLDHLRSLEGVHDVIQSVAFGKKGRMATHVQVLVAPQHLDAAIAACFTETTTIGLRHQIVQGAALTRRIEEVEIDGRKMRVKAVTRPDGRITGKTEASDVANQTGDAARVALRRAGEAAVLARLADPKHGTE